MKLIGKRKQIKLATQVVANYLIGKDALSRAVSEGSLSGTQWNDAVEHLTQNTVDIVTELVGIEGLKAFTIKYKLGVQDL